MGVQAADVPVLPDDAPTEGTAQVEPEHGSPAPTWIPRRLLALVGCGLALAASAALTAARLLGLDAGTAVALPMAGLPYVAAGTAIVALVLLGVKARCLALVAAVLLGVELAVVLPRFVPDARDVPATAPRLRVATSNAYQGRIDEAALVDLVRTARLDVLAVQEMTPDSAHALDGAGLRDLMPYRIVRPEADTALYSRRPLIDARALDRPTTWPQVTAGIDVGGHVVRLVAVHTFYPAGDPRRWDLDLRALRDEATETGADAVLLGDFNATLDHAPMRSLLDAGLVDSHAELGRGWAPTWPAGRPTLPPLIQLDHVLHGDGLAAVSVEERTIQGTDHRTIVAELAVVDS
ncbi:endonuclease/exonuclease/phosphatase family protein [Actinopolymorpha sp. B17G11]|uniref:endonuclease/exonuclease/phosphatase family protein n=1 Tax=Actinopolymorpha sp. B17G11 TaxID=3160861 RepID=UPI0032E43106